MISEGGVGLLPRPLYRSGEGPGCYARGNVASEEPYDTVSPQWKRTSRD